MNKLRNSILLGLALVGFNAWAISAPSITSVTARQRYPWNGFVDIDVTVGPKVRMRLRLNTRTGNP